MRKSPYKQLILAATLGPFGLFYTSAKAALAITLATLCGIYFLQQYVLYILPASAIASMVVGAYLVSYHNRKLTRNFQLSTYIGSVSCKVIGKEPVERDYQQALRKLRWRKFKFKIEIFSLVSLCIAFSAMIVTPHVRPFIQSASIPNMKLDMAHEVQPQEKLPFKSSQPVWAHHQDDNSFHSTLAARQYEDGSDGMYLPKIRLNCETKRYAVIFSIQEIFGTNTATLLISPENQPPSPQKWELGQNYRTAIAPSPRSLIKSLRSAKTIAVGYTPFGSQENKLATFDLTGSAKIISEFQSRCDKLQSTWREAPEVKFSASLSQQF